MYPLLHCCNFNNSIYCINLLHMKNFKWFFKIPLKSLQDYGCISNRFVTIKILIQISLTSKSCWITCVALLLFLEACFDLTCATVFFHCLEKLMNDMKLLCCVIFLTLPIFCCATTAMLLLRTLAAFHSEFFLNDFICRTTKIHNQFLSKPWN